MGLTINLDSEKVKLKLTRDGRLIDSVGFSYYHDLENKLITHLDRLLKRNRMGLDPLKSHKILGKIGREATSHKIAEAFLEGLKIKL